MPNRPRGAAEARRTEVAELLRARSSQRQIARALGVGLGTAARDTAAVRAEWRAQRLATMDELVAEELARLDRAEAVVWPLVLAGALPAVDRLLAIQERRARLLGLNAPPGAPAPVRVAITWAGADPDAV